VLVKVGVPLLGLKEYDTPDGKPDADSVTVVGEPERSVTVTVAEALPPLPTETLDGTDIEKSNWETVRVYVVVLVTSPPEPATVTV